MGPINVLLHSKRTFHRHVYVQATTRTTILFIMPKQTNKFVNLECPLNYSVSYTTIYSRYYGTYGTNLTIPLDREVFAAI